MAETGHMQHANKTTAWSMACRIKPKINRGRRYSQRNSGPINVRLKPDDFWAPTVAAENIPWHHSDTRIFWIIIRHIVFGSNLHLVKRIGHWVACGIKLWCCTASKCKQSCPKSCGNNVFCLLFWETDWEIRWIKPCLAMNKVRLPKPEPFVARTQKVTMSHSSLNTCDFTNKVAGQFMIINSSCCDHGYLMFYESIEQWRKHIIHSKKLNVCALEMIKIISWWYLFWNMIG